MDDVYQRALMAIVSLGSPFRRSVPSAAMGVIGTSSGTPFRWEDELPFLVNHPYWTRIWVIQEFLLATQLELRCGDYQIRFTDFETLLKDHIAGNALPGSWVTPSNVQSCAAAPMVIERRLNGHSIEPTHKLHTLLDKQQHSECADPRDRVFALLSLVIDDEKRILGNFFPDYTMSDDNVLIITLAFLRIRYYHFDLTEANNAIFLGLGVRSMSRRKTLLKQVDSYGGADLEHYRQQMAPSKVGLNSMGDDMITTDAGSLVPMDEGDPGEISRQLSRLMAKLP
jgi:hypothetical protein